MASVTEKKPCVKCPKAPGQVICDGCQRYFCLKHLLEHRQELSQQMDNLTLEHDQLQQNFILNDDDTQHPLIERVDRWEVRSINKIKQIANEVRQQLRESLDQPKKKLEYSLHGITKELQENRHTESYTETDLATWTNQLQQLRHQFENPPEINITNDENEASSTHLLFIQLKMIKQQKVVPRMVVHSTKWSTTGQMIAGGHGNGDGLDQLNRPFSVDVDGDGTLVIADQYNHRIMRWKPNALIGEIIAGAQGQGNQMDQLNRPMVVLVDRMNDSLIISDYGNRRVMRLSLDEPVATRVKGEVIITNITCVGLALDNEGSLYVSDFDRHEVRRFSTVDIKEGVIVAGSHGLGSALNQLNSPRHIFVDDDQSIYVSDLYNNRVIKWMKDAREGVVVAGGQGQGNGLGQLYCPGGILVDRLRTVYVVDQGNHRVMRWLKDAKQGERIVGGNSQGSQNNEFNQPISISFDDTGNLYIVDRNNNRIQRFDVQ